MEKIVFEQQPIDPRFEVPDTETAIERFLKYAGGVGRVDAQRLVFTKGLSDALATPIAADITFETIHAIIKHVPAVCEPLEVEVRCAMMAQLPAIARATIEVTAGEATPADTQEAVLQRAWERWTEYVLPLFRSSLHDDLRLVRSAAADALIAACNDAVAHLSKPGVTPPLATSPLHSTDAGRCGPGDTFGSSGAPVPTPASRAGRRPSDRLAPSEMAFERPYEKVHELCPDGYTSVCNVLLSIMEELGVHDVHWFRALVPKLIAGIMPFLLGDRDNRAHFASACLSRIRQIAQDDSEIVRAELARSLAAIWCPPVLLGVRPWDRLLADLRDTLQRLAIDYDADVRRAVAVVVPALAAHCPPAVLPEYMCEVFSNLLTDEEDRVAVAAGAGLGAMVSLLSGFADAEMCASTASPDTPSWTHRRHKSEFRLSSHPEEEMSLIRSTSFPHLRSTSSGSAAATSLPQWHTRHLLDGMFASSNPSNCPGLRYSMASELKLLLSASCDSPSSSKHLNTCEMIVHTRRNFGVFTAAYRALLAQLVAFSHGKVIGEKAGNRDTLLDTPLYAAAPEDVVSSPAVGLTNSDDEEEDDSAFDFAEMVTIDEIEDGTRQPDVLSNGSSSDSESEGDASDVNDFDFEDDFSVGDIRNRRIEHAARALPAYFLSLVSVAEQLSASSGKQALHILRELSHRFAVGLACVRRVSSSADPNGKATVTLLASLPDIMTCARFVAQALQTHARGMQLTPDASGLDPDGGPTSPFSPAHRKELHTTLALVDDLALDNLNIEVLLNALARSGDVSRLYAVRTAVRLLRELPSVHYPRILHALLGACGLETFMPEPAGATKVAASPAATVIADSHDWHNHALFLQRLPELAGTLSSDLLADVVVPIVRQFLRDDIAIVRCAAADACIPVLGALILRIHEGELLPDTSGFGALLTTGERKSLALQVALTPDNLADLMSNASIASRGGGAAVTSRLRNALQDIMKEILSLGRSVGSSHHERASFVRLCTHLSQLPSRSEPGAPTPGVNAPVALGAITGIAEELGGAHDAPDVEVKLDVSAVTVHRGNARRSRSSMLRRASARPELSASTSPMLTRSPALSPRTSLSTAVAVDGGAEAPTDQTFQRYPFVSVAALLLAELQPEKELVDRHYEIPAYWQRRKHMAQLCGIIVKDMALENDVTMCIAAPEYFCCRQRADFPVRMFDTLSLSPLVLPATGQTMAEYFESLKQKKLVGLPPDLESPFYSTAECEAAARTLYNQHFHPALSRQLLQCKPDSFDWKQIEALVGPVATKSARYHWAPRLAAMEAARTARAATVRRLQELAPPVNTANLVIHHLPAWPPPSLQSAPLTRSGMASRRPVRRPGQPDAGTSAPQLTLGDIADLAAQATEFDAREAPPGGPGHQHHRRSRGASPATPDHT